MDNHYPRTETIINNIQNESVLSLMENDYPRTETIINNIQNESVLT